MSWVMPRAGRDLGEEDAPVDGVDQQEKVVADGVGERLPQRLSHHLDGDLGGLGVAVQQQLDAVLVVLQATEQLQAALSVAHRRDVLGERHEDVLTAVERSQRQLVEPAHAVDDHEVVVAAQELQQGRHVGSLDLLRLFDLAALGQHADARAVLGHRRGQQLAVEAAHVGEHVGDGVAPRDVEERQHVTEMEIEIDQADAQRPALHRAGQVGGDGGRPHAPLGAEDGDHLTELAGAEGDLGVSADRQPQLLVVALQHELARAGPHRTEDQLGILALRDDDDDPARGGDVVNETEPLRRVRFDRDDGGAGVDAPVLVRDLLGGRLGADDVGHVLEREAQIGLLRVVHSKQQYRWSRHLLSS